MSERSAGRAGVPTAVTLCAVAAAVVYCAVEATLLGGHLGFPLDDSWIHLQFARNLAAGAGLSYNPGELVTGSTSPLWTALLSLLFHLPGNVVAWTKLAGISAFVLAVRATFRLGRLTGLDRRLSTLASLLTAGTYWLVWSALSGMEICLFLWLSLEGLILQTREVRGGGQRALALPVLGLAALARPEGLLLLMLAVAERVVQRLRSPAGEARRGAWRALLLGAVGAAVVAVPTFAFYAVVGGSPLPTTFGAKAGVAHVLLPDGRYLIMVLGVLFRPQPWLTLLAGGGMAALGWRWLRSRHESVLPALWVLALPFAYSLLAQGKSALLGNFGRYYFPLFPLVILLGCLALAAARSGAVDVPRRALWRALAIVVLALPTFYTLLYGAAFYARNVVNVEDGDVRAGLWLARHVPPQALIAVQDIGAMKFFAPQPVLDLAGIVTPAVQGAVRGAISPEDRTGQAGMLRFLAERRPDYLVVFPSWYPALVASGTGFELVHGFDVPDNITLADDRLLVFKTPWTRYPLGDTEP